MPADLNDDFTLENGEKLSNLTENKDVETNPQDFQKPQPAIQTHSPADEVSVNTTNMQFEDPHALKNDESNLCKKYESVPDNFSRATVIVAEVHNTSEEEKQETNNGKSLPNSADSKNEIVNQVTEKSDNIQAINLESASAVSSVTNNPVPQKCVQENASDKLREFLKSNDNEMENPDVCNKITVTEENSTISEIQESKSLACPETETIGQDLHGISSDDYKEIKRLICSNETDDSGIDSELSKSDESNIGSDISYQSTDDFSMGFPLHDPSLPEYFNILISGMKVCGDSRCSLDSKPSWFNAEKFSRGQQVAMKYFFGLQFAQMISLLLVLNLPDGLTPLVFTGKSDTPFKAFKRYLSTALRVRSWYLDDLWDPDTEAYKNLKTVRAMHENIRSRLKAADPEEIAKQSSLMERCECPHNAIWSPLHEKLREDFEGTCPYPRISQYDLIKLHKMRDYVNQTDMAVTQFGFVGLFILYPEYFGAHNVTDDELDGFVHLWQCIGYLLGIEDKYNYCAGGLQIVKQRTCDLIEIVIKPSLRLISQDWEHMTRCVTEGISYYVQGVSWEVSLLYLCNMLGLHTPRLRASLTFAQKLMYYITCAQFWFTLRIPGAYSFFNWTVRVALKRAQTASPTWLRELESKKYPFQENSICSQ